MTSKRDWCDFYSVSFSSRNIELLLLLRDLCCVTVSRFHDAGYYFWKLSVQCLDLVSAENAKGEPDYEMLDKFHEYQEKAEMYHLYHSIQRYTVSDLL